MHASAQRAKNILVEDLTETFTRPPEASNKSHKKQTIRQRRNQWRRNVIYVLSKQTKEKVECRIIERKSDALSSREPTDLKDKKKTKNKQGFSLSAHSEPACCVLCSEYQPSTRTMQRYMGEA